MYVQDPCYQKCSQLEEKDMEGIVKIMLSNVVSRMKERNITVNFSDEAIEKLAIDGYDREYGARPLRREITRQVEDGLSEEILSGELEDNSVIDVGVIDGKFTFDVKKNQ